MAKKNKQTAAVATEEVEIEAPKGTRPKDLAEKLDVNPKQLRAWLRTNFPRGTEEKNTSWTLTDAMVTAATEHFTKSDEEDSPEDEE